MARRPTATELVPVATDESPTATLTFVAVAPNPPPMAMELASTEAGVKPPVVIGLMIIP
ncbi:hypothetical protein D3C87_1669040 [compost metagenome]